jgi:hypothetical protein
LKRLADLAVRALTDNAPEEMSAETAAIQKQFNRMHFIHR